MTVVQEPLIESIGDAWTTDIAVRAVGERIAVEMTCTAEWLSAGGRRSNSEYAKGETR